VLQQLGEDEDSAHLIFLGTLPSRTSPATKLITDSLPGIDLRHCIYREESQEASSSYIIKSEAADSRTIVNYNELKEMSVDEFVEAAKRIANGVATGAQFWFHFEVCWCVAWIDRRIVIQELRRGTLAD
jgi:ketohexokinase